jgi:CheY-like chemotaxis protein
MGSLSGLTLLIFDESKNNAVHLRHCLVRGGATVHTVSAPSAALMLARNKRIDTAFLDLVSEGGCPELVEELRSLKIPVIFTGNTLPSELTLHAVLIAPRDNKPRQLQEAPEGTLIATAGGGNA